MAKLRNYFSQEVVVTVLTNPNNKLGGGLQQTLLRHPVKFQPDCAYGLRDVRYQHFHFLALGANPLAKVSPKSTILPDFIVLRQPTPEISVTKKSCGQTNTDGQKPTVDDISTTCMPIAYRHVGIKSTRDKKWMALQM